MEEYTSKIIDGPYRFLLSVVLFIQMSNCNIIGQIFPFFFIDPIVECDDQFKNPETGICNLDEMCKSNAEFRINKSETLYNWSSLFNLYCPRSSYKLVLTTLYFIASAVFPILISSLPDRFGRMRVLNYLMILMLIAFILLLFNYQILHMISMFLCGGLIMIYNVEIQIITEYYDANVRGFLTGIFCAAIPIFGSLSIFMFYFLHNVTCFWWMLIITQIFCIAVINFYYIESPLWLISVNKFDDSLKQVEKAAKINNKMSEYEEFAKIAHKFNTFTSKDQESKVYSFKDVLCFASVRKIIIAIAPYWIAVLLFDFTVFLNLEKSNKNIYLQGIVVFISCAISALIAGYLADLLGRKKMLIISVFFAVVPYILSPYCNAHGYVALETFFLFVACIAIETAFTVIIIYVGEIFPTTIRSTASGLLYLSSRIGAIAAPYAVFFFSYPQYIVSILLLLSLYSIWHLPETKGKTLPTDIEENLLGKKEGSFKMGEIIEEENTNGEKTEMTKV